MPAQLEGKVYKTVVRPAMLYGAGTWATANGQEARIKVNEVRMAEKDHRCSEPDAMAMERYYTMQC